MSNKLKYTRRLMGGQTVGYDVYREHTRLGVVRRENSGTGWRAEYPGDRALGTYATRAAAGHRLWAEHTRRYGLSTATGEPKADPRPPQSRYAVIEGDDLAQLHYAIVQAMYARRAVRFTVHNGIKWDAGHGWTPSKGRPADESGH